MEVIMQETSEATPTQTDLPSPAEVAEAPATPAPETDAPEPEAPSEPVETPAPSAEEPAQPFATIKGQPVEDQYGVLDHEEMQPHLERRDRRVEERIRQEYQGQFEEAKRGLEASHAHKTLAGIYGNILQKLQDGDIDGAERLIDRMEGAIEPYKEDYIKGLRNEGSMGASQHIMGVLRDTLGRREQESFEDFCATRRNATWKDVIDQYVELRAVTAKRPLQEENRSLKAENEQLKQRLREGKGPDLTPKGAGGETDKTKARRDYAEGRISTDEAERLGIV